MSEAAAPARPRPGPLAALRSFYRPEPVRAPLADEAGRTRLLATWRWRMFAGFFTGYFVLYFCRLNLSNAVPFIATDLKLTNAQIGLVTTALMATYGLGKFLNGVLADRSNIRRFMATGLVVSGLLNLWFSSAATLWLMALVWGLNGWFQSMGFPPIARGMTLWFPREGKSTRWAFWTCSHQAGTAAIMGFTAWILTWGTWRDCFRIPALMTIAMGVVLLWLMADTPESRGLPSAKAFEGEAPAPAEHDPKEYRRLFVKHVLRNRNVWAIGLMDFCVYVIRYGTLTWTSKFLIEDKGYAKTDAGFVATLMPIAGVVGVLASGFIADAVFKARYKVLNVVFMVALGGCLFGLQAVGAGHFWLDFLFLAGIGFFVEGPQSILGGVGAVDAGGSARVAASAAGLVGILAYAGASLSGYGTGQVIDHFRWSGAFTFWIAFALLGVLVGTFLWKEPKTRAGH